MQLDEIKTKKIQEALKSKQITIIKIRTNFKTNTNYRTHLNF
jgi:hypothetical protein